MPTAPPKTCYVNGEYLTDDRVTVPVRDLAFLRGYGVFDFMQSHGGKVFRLRDHYDRFVRSAAALDLTVPVAFPEFEAIVARLVEVNGRPAFTVRSVLTGGCTPDGIQFGPPNLYVLFEDEVVYPPEIYTHGARLATIEHRREFPEAKTLHYIAAVKARNALKSQGVLEVLYVDRGRVLEASTSNVFAFLGNILVTPDQDILPGITRKVVLEFAGSAFPVEVRELAWSELCGATEVFITSTSKEIVPVTRIDDRVVGDGKVGPNTRRLMDLFAAYVRAESAAG
jgi:branched-subunit amino acid aminotransferase/4-amino-4-deoxychorismate lyase